MCTQYNIKNVHNWLFIPNYTLNNYLRSWVIECSIDTQNLKILCTQWYNRKYELIEHSITTQNCNLLSTQDWVLNNHLFLLGDWVLNNPKIEWTLQPHYNTILLLNFRDHMSKNEGPKDQEVTTTIMTQTQVSNSIELKNNDESWNKTLRTGQLIIDFDFAQKRQSKNIISFV